MDDRRPIVPFGTRGGRTGNPNIERSIVVIGFRINVRSPFGVSDTVSSGPKDDPADICMLINISCEQLFQVTLGNAQNHDAFQCCLRIFGAWEQNPAVIRIVTCGFFFSSLRDGLAIIRPNWQNGKQ
jgi:hypothetical protein